LKILLVDRSATSPTAKIVATAIEDHTNAGTREGRIEYQVINPLELENRTRLLDDGSTVLVSSGEADLSSRSQASAKPRHACASLALAQSLATAHKVYLLRHSDTSPFCGVDLVAALLSGLAGILDDRELLRDAVLAALTAHVPRDRRHTSMLAIGRYAAPIQELKTMLDTWDEDVDWDPTLDPSCWRAATALAQLDELLPIRGIGGDRSPALVMESPRDAVPVNTGAHHVRFRPPQHLFSLTM
jgi:hypothetical protein